jgi:hypothetical protein
MMGIGLNSAVEIFEREGLLEACFLLAIIKIKLY